jgi:peptide/nickel transport system permease protein
MLAFAVRRLLVSIPVFIVSTFLVFLLVTWGADPLAQLKAKNPPPSQAVINALADQLYINHPLPARYWHWFSQLFFHGNWGPRSSRARTSGSCSAPASS